MVAHLSDEGKEEREALFWPLLDGFIVAIC
jgi:hypothetical protein